MAEENKPTRKKRQLATHLAGVLAEGPAGGIRAMTQAALTSEAPTALRSASSSLGYQLLARDGTVGKVVDSYFTGKDWYFRFFVVNTGSWLNERLVLISPICCGHPDSNRSSIPVDLSIDQVRASPIADLARPVSRRYEIDLHAFYGWPLPVPAVGPRVRKIATAGPLGHDSLRSMKEVTGYRILATDGEIGHVEDFIVEEPTWRIRYVVVATRSWLPGRRVLVAPDWISELQWPEGRVSVDLTRDAIRDSPEFDPAQPVDRRYEDRLFDYYGRPAYWDRSGGVP